MLVVYLLNRNLRSLHSKRVDTRRRLEQFSLQDLGLYLINWKGSCIKSTAAVEYCCRLASPRRGRRPTERRAYFLRTAHNTACLFVRRRVDHLRPSTPFCTRSDLSIAIERPEHVALKPERTV